MASSSKCVPNLKQKDIKRPSPSRQPSDLELILDGFFKQTAACHNLDIPQDITGVVTLYVASEFVIDDNNVNMRAYKYETTDDNTYIRALNKAAYACIHRLLYFRAMYQMNNNNGFGRGIHKLSIRPKMDNMACMHAIGITAQKRKTITLRECAEYWPNTGESYIRNTKWKQGDIITVVLDCTQWVVKYYVNSELKKDLTTRIQSNRSYWFAMVGCDDADHGMEIEIVNDPKF